MRVAIGRSYDAPSGVVDAANAALATLAPRSDVLNWLHCYYEPGEPWAPVERLVIAEVIPRSALEANRRAMHVPGESLLDELEGPNPRAQAVWSHRQQRFVYPDGVLPPSITHRQWQLFRAIDGFALPQWIVQGDAGGHVRALNRAEQRVLAEVGRASDVPAPGALPFAVVDDRTVQKLRQRDRLSEWLKSRGAEWSRRNVDDVARARRDVEKAFNRELLSWLDSQFQEQLSEDARHVDVSDLPLESLEDSLDWDAVDAAFLDDTDVDAVTAANTTRGERTLVAV